MRNDHLILIEWRTSPVASGVPLDMPKIFVLGVLGLLGACVQKHYYVANLYQSNGMIYVEKCPVYNNGRGDTADPRDCHIASIPELPAAAVASRTR